MIDYELTESNRQVLAEAFKDSRRVDMSIDCVIEGRMGKAFVDDAIRPSVFKIEAGPFSYFAGDASSAGAQEMVEALTSFASIMPCAPEWLELARDIHGDRLTPYTRYSFSSERLSVDHLRRLLDDSPHKDGIGRIDAAVAARLQNEYDGFHNLSEFGSPERFAAEGIGYYLSDSDVITGVAYSSLICSRGVEVSIFVAPDFRRQGVALALACALLLECLEKSLHPNWDAANPESCRLAEKLGYIFAGEYQEHYIKPPTT